MIKEAERVLWGQQETRDRIGKAPGTKRGFGEDQGWEEFERAQKLGETGQ